MSRRRPRLLKDAKRQQILQRYAHQRVRNRLAKPGRYPLAIVLNELKAGYNVAKIFRSALAMGTSAVHLVNVGPFDPAPAKGAFRKVPAYFHDGFDAARTAIGTSSHQWFAFSPDAEILLPEVTLPARSVFVFGHEERGLGFEAADHPDITWLRIPLAGPMESLNVSIAASIAMYEYVRQQGHEEPHHCE